MNKNVYRITGILLVLLIWQVIGMIGLTSGSFRNFEGFLPLPAFTALIEMISTWYFWESVVSSISRILIGVGFAVLAGIPTGLVIGLSKKAFHLTEIPIQFLRMISPLSWMPIAVLLLPTFDQSIIFLLSITCVWSIILGTSQGVMHVEQGYIDMALNQGANRRQLLFRIIIPFAFPYMLTGVRVSLGIGWVILVPAEFLGISHGLGFMINNARDAMEYDRLMAVVIAIGFIGFTMDSFFRYIQARFDRYLVR